MRKALTFAATMAIAVGLVFSGGNAPAAPPAPPVAYSDYNGNTVWG